MSALSVSGCQQRPARGAGAFVTCMQPVEGRPTDSFPAAAGTTMPLPPAAVRGALAGRDARTAELETSVGHGAAHLFHRTDLPMPAGPPAQRGRQSRGRQRRKPGLDQDQRAGRREIPRARDGGGLPTG